MEETKTMDELKAELAELLEKDARTKEEKRRINAISVAIGNLKKEAKGTAVVESTEEVSA